MMYLSKDWLRIDAYLIQFMVRYPIDSSTCGSRSQKFISINASENQMNVRCSAFYTISYRPVLQKCEIQFYLFFPSASSAFYGNLWEDTLFVLQKTFSFLCYSHLWMNDMNKLYGTMIMQTKLLLECHKCLQIPSLLI